MGVCQAESLISGWPFSNAEDFPNLFTQKGTWLRIHASKDAQGKSSSGLLSSAHEDGGGFYATPPFYMECRFLAQSSPGTWPARCPIPSTGASRS